MKHERLKYTSGRVSVTSSKFNSIALSENESTRRLDHRARLFEIAVGESAQSSDLEDPDIFFNFDFSTDHSNGAGW